MSVLGGPVIASYWVPAGQVLVLIPLTLGCAQQSTRGWDKWGGLTETIECLTRDENATRANGTVLLAPENEDAHAGRESEGQERGRVLGIQEKANSLVPIA